MIDHTRVSVGQVLKELDAHRRQVNALTAAIDFPSLIPGAAMSALQIVIAPNTEGPAGPGDAAPCA